MIKHKCAVDGCEVQISVEMLCCWPHWRMVPRALQLEVWRTVKLADRTEYHVAVKAALKAIVPELPLFEKQA